MRVIGIFSVGCVMYNFAGTTDARDASERPTVDRTLVGLLFDPKEDRIQYNVPFAKPKQTWVQLYRCNECVPVLNEKQAKVTPW